jgi:hypothetical protein
MMEDSTVFGLALKIMKKTSRKTLVCRVLILCKIVDLLANAFLCL